MCSSLLGHGSHALACAVCPSSPNRMRALVMQRGCGVEHTRARRHLTKTLLVERRMSLVTVVIPAYNAVATISDAIDSVLAQTLQDFEIIVSDDGSRDGTAAQVSRYRGTRELRYIRHENRGASTQKHSMPSSQSEYLALS